MKKLVILACVISVIAIIAVSAVTALGGGVINNPIACNAMLQAKTQIEAKTGPNQTITDVYNTSCVN